MWAQPRLWSPRAAASACARECGGEGGVPGAPPQQNAQHTVARPPRADRVPALGLLLPRRRLGWVGDDQAEVVASDLAGAPGAARAEMSRRWRPPHCWLMRAAARLYFAPASRPPPPSPAAISPDTRATETAWRLEVRMSQLQRVSLSCLHLTCAGSWSQPAQKLSHEHFSSQSARPSAGM